jgi:hypothetical protein
MRQTNIPFVGFHMELTGMIVEEGEVLRATWGLRYRFKKKEGN